MSCGAAVMDNTPANEWNVDFNTRRPMFHEFCKFYYALYLSLIENLNKVYLLISHKYALIRSFTYVAACDNTRERHQGGGEGAWIKYDNIHS